MERRQQGRALATIPAETEGEEEAEAESGGGLNAVETMTSWIALLRRLLKQR